MPKEPGNRAVSAGGRCQLPFATWTGLLCWDAKITESQHSWVGGTSQPPAPPLPPAQAAQGPPVAWGTCRDGHPQLLSLVIWVLFISACLFLGFYFLSPKQPFRNEDMFL